MGILNFFKNIYRKGNGENEIKFEELNNWLESKVKKKIGTIESEIASIKNKADKEKEKLKENLIILENAKLKNQNIPERMKQIMEGNRNIYIQKMKTLLETIEFPGEIDNVLAFYDSFDKTMNSFSKSIMKSHNIMQEFFANESGAISSNIINLDKFIKESKKIIENSNLGQFNYLKMEIEEAQKKTKRKENSNGEIQAVTKRISDFDNYIKEKEKKLKELNESNEFMQFKDSTYKKTKLQEEMLNLEKELKQNFSDIEAGLKRYSSLNKDDVLSKNYLKNPVNALFDDKELEIVDLANKIKNYLSEGSIELKDKKKEKVLKGLKEFNKEYFDGFFSKRGQINNEINKLAEDIEKNRAIDEISALHKEIERDYACLENAKKELNNLNKELNEINVNSLKEELRQKILDNFGERIRII